MTPSEQIAFYAEALQVRDIGSDVVDLILEAEGIDMTAATIDQCKAAIVKWQYVDDADPWTWRVEEDYLYWYLREQRQRQQ